MAKKESENEDDEEEEIREKRDGGLDGCGSKEYIEYLLYYVRNVFIILCSKEEIKGREAESVDRVNNRARVLEQQLLVWNGMNECRC